MEVVVYLNLPGVFVCVNLKVKTYAHTTIRQSLFYFPVLGRAIGMRSMARLEHNECVSNILTKHKVCGQRRKITEKIMRSSSLSRNYFPAISVENP